MYWLPKTKIGKISFWVVITGFALLFIPYWIAVMLNTTTVFSFGFLAIGLIVIFGTTSVVAIVKYKDRAILLFVSALLGLLGWLLVLGEFLVPH